MQVLVCPPCKVPAEPRGSAHPRNCPGKERTPIFSLHWKAHFKSGCGAQRASPAPGRSVPAGRPAWVTLNNDSAVRAPVPPDQGALRDRGREVQPWFTHLHQTAGPRGPFCLLDSESRPASLSPRVCAHQLLGCMQS